MSSRDHRRADPHVSYDGVVDLGSLPPPAVEHKDVYRSQTAVKSMTDTLKDEIQRAREEAKLHETEMTRAVPKFQMPDEAIPGFTDEAPTRPGTAADNVPEKSGAIRRTDLPSVMLSAAEDEGARVTIDITPPLVAPPTPPPATPPWSFAETIPAAEPSLPPIDPALVVPRAVWPRVLLVALAVVAAIVTAFTARRYFGSAPLP